MKVTKIVLSRPAFQFQNDDPSQKITALMWDVIFESGKLCFEASNLQKNVPLISKDEFTRRVKEFMPAIYDVQLHADNNPEFVKPSLRITK